MKKEPIPVNLIGMDCSGFGITRGQTRAILHFEKPAKPTPGTANLLLVEQDPENSSLGWRAVRRDGEVKRVYCLGLESDGATSGGMFSGLWADNGGIGFPYETPIPCHTRVE